MAGKDWAIWIPLVLATIQTFYAVATFHRDQLKLSIKNRPLLVMAVFTALTWAATYVNYKMMSSPAAGQLVDYGTDGPEYLSWGWRLY